MAHHTIEPGDVVQFGSAQLVAMVPHDIMNYLGSRGWSMIFQDKWEHHDKGRDAMTWEQAMAVEFYEFITLGGR